MITGYWQVPDLLPITNFPYIFLCVNRLLLWLLPLLYEAMPTCPERHFTWDNPTPGAMWFLLPRCMPPSFLPLLAWAVNYYSYLKHMAATPATKRHKAMKKGEANWGEMFKPLWAKYSTNRALSTRFEVSVITWQNDSKIHFKIVNDL